MKNIYVILILFFSLSCSQDEIPEINNDNNLPSNFNITINNVTTNSATINWTPSTDNENSNIRYKIYLNNNLIVENFTSLEYDLNNLNSSEIYSITIIALNNFGETAVNSSFTTLQQQKLTKVININNYININYNDNGKIIQRYRYNSSDVVRAKIDYEYNNNGLLVNKFYHIISDGTRREIFTYDNDDNLIEYVSHYTPDFTVGSTSHFIFDINNHSYTETVNSSNSEIFSYDYSVNENNNIITIHKINNETLEESSFIFEYLNDNLIKIIGDTFYYDISYDNSNNYFKYFDIKYSYNAGFYFSNFNIVNRIIGRYLPVNYRFVNKNNPIEVKLNGIIIKEMNYEYDERNYPKKVIIDGDFEIDLEYN